MNFRPSDESASPARSLASKHLIVTGALALSLCLLTLLSAASPAHALVEGKDFKTGQVIVKLDPTIGATIEEINARYSLTTQEKLPGSTGIYLLKVQDGSDTDAVVRRLVNDPRLLYAEPNFVAEAPEDHAGDGRHNAYGISDTNGSFEQYAATALGLPCAAALTLGQNTTVAVIDTGTQLDHAQLAPNFEDVARYDFVDNDGNPTERSVGLDEDGDGLKDELVGHGTHVAGIVDLVAPSAKIMPLRVLDTEGYGDVFTIAKAFSYAKRNGANVINLSLGSSHRSAMLQGVIKDAIKNGVFVSAAAGNSNTTIPHYPAAGNGTTAFADGLAAVTSVDMYAKKSDYANYGTWVDIAAPGDGIRSTFPISMYANWSGTSMATPFISGQAALIHAVYSSLDPMGVEMKIRNSAQPLTLQNLTYVGMLGAGEANVCASLQ
jgi:subtilisin family serine protease